MIKVALPSINMVRVKQYGVFLVVGVVILVELLAAVLYLPRQVFSLIDLKDEVTVLSQRQVELAAAEEALGEVDDGQVNNLLLRAEKALPDEKRVAGVVSGISALASSAGVITKSIEFSPGIVSTSSGSILVSTSEKDEGEKVKSVPVSMSVTSTLPQFLDFLKQILKSGQLLGVTSINYSLTGGQPGGDMSLVVYFLPARIGKPDWNFIPSITEEDLAVLDELSNQNVFNLP